MVILSIGLVVIVIFIFWLLIEYVQAATLNDFLDKKIMRRFLWLWLPIYALWRLSKEVIFKSNK